MAGPRINSAHIRDPYALAWASLHGGAAAPLRMDQVLMRPGYPLRGFREDTGFVSFVERPYDPWLQLASAPRPSSARPWSREPA
jgi:hypothetical protein